MTDKGAAWIWFVLIVCAGVGVFSISSLAPWNTQPAVTRPSIPIPIPGPPPPLGGSSNGRFEPVELADGTLLLLDTVTGDLFRTEPR